MTYSAQYSALRELQNRGDVSAYMRHGRSSPLCTVYFGDDRSVTIDFSETSAMDLRALFSE